MRKEDLVKLMQSIDFCMMTTVDGRGTLHSRPMSNNREVKFDGNTYFFSYQDTGKVRQLENSNRVSLTYQGENMSFLQAYGDGHIITDRSTMKPYWLPDLERWFPDGLETKGLVMIRVAVHRVSYWVEEGDGEITL